MIRVTKNRVTKRLLLGHIASLSYRHQMAHYKNYEAVSIPLCEICLIFSRVRICRKILSKTISGGTVVPGHRSPLKPGGNISNASQKQSCDKPTHSEPMECMRDPVLGLIGVRYSLGDVLGFGIMGIETAANVNMNMSSHRLAHQIAQHWRPIVI